MSRSAPLALGSLLAFALGAALVGCSSTPTRPALPEQPAGCAVELFYGSPTADTQNLGLVSATCSDEVGEKGCLRQLQDEVCKLGGDVVWGVSEKPERVGEKNKYAGRAAITKTAAPKPSAP